MLIKNVHVQSLWEHVDKYLIVYIGVSVYTENEEVFIIHNYLEVLWTVFLIFPTGNH